MMFVPTFQPKSKLKKGRRGEKSPSKQPFLLKILGKRKDTMTTLSLLLMSFGEQFFNSLMYCSVAARSQDAPSPITSIL
jgi:hypothetical protein